jgi:signal transduction histidine kinase/CheY-like chemotaxis protein
MFPLLRYFSLASFVALGLITAVVVVLNRNVAISQLVEIAEAENIALTQVLSNHLWPRFGAYVASVTRAEVGALRARSETADLRETLRELQHDLPLLLKVKIYNLDGLTVFSTQESQIGEDRSSNPGFVAAAQGGKPASKISRRGKFSAFSGEVYDRSIVETYVPVRRGNGPVEGVFEVYSDVSALITLIDEKEMKLWISLVSTFALLYAALFLIVRHADRILRQQYEKILAREADLVHEKQKAEAAARAEGEFLANMSHEIRTPMTAMLGFAQTLSEQDRLGDASSQPSRAIETIQRCGAHLMQIVDKILDRARLRAGRLELKHIAFSPTAIVEEVLSLLRPQAEAKGLALELEVDSSTPAAAESDATRIRQILINLVGNAIKFTEAGAVRVTAGYRDHRGEPMLQFEVIDTGIGMSPDQIKAMFEPFTQVDGTTTRSHEGIGLGLTICKGLSALLGGTIDVESEPGKGSTFRVNVPCTVVDRARLLQADGEVSAVEKREGPRTLERARRRLRGRVLVAEDNRDNQRLIADTLQEAGAEVELADNGAIAVEMVREWQHRGRPFDLVLVDMQMPILDGHEAARRLRGMGYEGPIVALTAHAMQTDRQKCLEAGCDDYLAKPIERQRLVRLIARYTDTRSRSIAS